MLLSLKIHNIALISDCEIEFSNGLCVLSGETGAGKSVILDSINFLLGQKADKSMIMHGESECSASCVFDVSNCPSTLSALEDLGFEDETQVIIKRTFSDSGKGSIRLNGETVTLSMLRKVTSTLVDVHGQSDHFSLLKESAQLDLIDGLNPNDILPKKQEIAEIIAKIKAVRESLDKLGGSDTDRLKRLDYLSFAINEIENANIFEGEEELLIEKRKKLQNAEKIINAVSGANQVINGENGATDALSLAYRSLSGISHLSKEYESISQEVENCIFKLQEINDKLCDFLDEDFDFSEADETEKRIELISSLKAKYGGSYEKIIKTLNDFKDEYELLSTSTEKAEKLKKEEDELFIALYKKYDELSTIRKKSSAEFSQELVTRLRDLAMQNANFTVEFEKAESERKLSYNGIDTARFMFSANRGEPLKPLDKVISGGELSRLMLAIKSVNLGDLSPSTYIFDEIDAGISGVTALVVAKNFAKISKKKQIIAISHLPQIVSMSDSSLFISKSDDGARTRTSVLPLKESEKVVEVMRLIGGDENSASAKATALEMIESANNFKKTLN